MNLTAQAARIPGLDIRNHLDQDSAPDDISRLRQGLRAEQKQVEAKYFYDQRGSVLFERICQTPEYYPTRTELSILDRRAKEIMEFFSSQPGDLVELGSGSNQKVRRLLDAAQSHSLDHMRYVPVDISQSALTEAALELSELYPGLRIIGVAADFTQHLDRLPQGRKMICFLGSSMGNFSREQCLGFLGSLQRSMSFEDRLVLGLDMVKSTEVLEAAYNDAQGITAQFNLNLLRNLNRRFGADFDQRDFVHHAFFNQDEQRIEMHLAAKRRLRVRLAKADLTVRLEADETIRTEISQKYTPQGLEDLFAVAGLEMVKRYSDERDWFWLVELRATCA